ncbi:MAG: LURP-one-related family protein [Candidatus Heimdallarchaeaceae archaeon]
MSEVKPMGFKVQQKILALVATYKIYDLATDQQIFEAKRKMFTLTPTLIIRDMAGVEVIKIKSNFFFQNSWKIYQQDKLIGEVTFPIIRFCGIKFDVKLAGNVYTASDVLGYSFSAVDLSGNIGFKLDRKVFSIRDTYKVETYPPLDPLFALAAALAIDSKYFQR